MKISDYVFASFLFSAGGLSISAAVMGTVSTARQIEIKGAYPVSDLNSDELPDLVIERASGRKTPLYGVRDGENIDYVPAEEIERLSTESRVDYQEIEANLNRGKK